MRCAAPRCAARIGDATQCYTAGRGSRLDRGGCRLSIEHERLTAAALLRWLPPPEATRSVRDSATSTADEADEAPHRTRLASAADAGGTDNKTNEKRRMAIVVPIPAASSENKSDPSSRQQQQRYGLIIAITAQTSWAPPGWRQAACCGVFGSRGGARRRHAGRKHFTSGLR